MTILTDILSLFKRKQIIETPSPEDLIVLGRHEQPDILGIASPIPYKSVKLVKLKDIIQSPASCSYQNLKNNGGTITVGLYKATTASPCVVGFRSLTTIGNNISIVENQNEIEISTTGEPNLAQNTGTGVPLFTNKIGETLNFKSISSDESILISSNENNTEIKISLERVILSSPNGNKWELSINDLGQITTTLLT